MLYCNFFRALLCDNPEPPTIYQILNSYLNYGNPNPVKITDLAKMGRDCIFDFDYPISKKFNKEEFETIILNHYLMRKIGYETITAFKIELNVKLNEIMPNYNLLIDSISDWNLFNDGEIETREQNIKSNNNTNSTINNSNSTINIADNRYSDTPQNNLEDVQNGNYISNYTYDTNKSNSSSESNNNSSSNDNSNLNEKITRTPSDKINLYTNFLEKKQNIYSMIFKDLDSLFYQII